MKLGHTIESIRQSLSSFDSALGSIAAARCREPKLEIVLRLRDWIGGRGKWECLWVKCVLFVTLDVETRLPLFCNTLDDDGYRLLELLMFALLLVFALLRLRECWSAYKGCLVTRTLRFLFKLCRFVNDLNGSVRQFFVSARFRSFRMKTLVKG